MKSQHTEDKVDPSLPVVKISWTTHGREYTIGINGFLRALGYSPSNEEIKKAVRIILNTQ